MGECGALRAVDESLHGRSEVRGDAATQEFPFGQSRRQTQHPDARVVSGPAGEENTQTVCATKLR